MMTNLYHAKRSHFNPKKSLFKPLGFLAHHPEPWGSILSIFTVNCAAKATGCAQHLKHSAFEGLGVRTTTHRTGDSEHIFPGQIAIVGDVLHLLAIPWRFFESFDQQRCGRWNNLNSDLAVLHQELACHLHALPVLGSFAESSPTDFGDNLWGPTLGARAGTGGTSPPGTRTMIVIIALGSAFAMVDLSDQRSPC